MMNRPMRDRGRPTERGVALLLVLVAIAIGLMLTATWLDGRRESIPVARRIAAVSIAQHAAVGGMELAVATLDAEEDWRSAIDEGRFDEPVALDEATLHFQVVDADDAEPVDRDTVRVRVSCTATVEEMTSTSERIVVFEPEDAVVDLGFGETAIVAERSIRILDRAALLPWTAREQTDVGPLVIGTLDGVPGAVELGPEAVAPGTEVLLVDSDFDAAAAPLPGRRVLPEPLPSLASPEVPQAAPLPGSHARLIESAIAGESEPATRSRSFVPDRVLVVNEDRVVRSDDDIVTDPGTRILVERGTLVLDADRNVHLREAEIEVAPEGRLVLRAGRQLRLEDTSILGGDADRRSLAPGEALPTEAMSLADRVTLTGSDGMTLELAGDCDVVATVMAPGTTVRVLEDSVLHGRIVAERVELRDRAIVFARPDDGRVIGLTASAGPHRNEDGRLLDSVCEPNRTEPEALASIAEELGVAVCATGEVATPSPSAEESRSKTVREGVERRRWERRQRREQRRAERRSRSWR